MIIDVVVYNKDESINIAYKFDTKRKIFKNINFKKKRKNKRFGGR